MRCLGEEILNCVLYYFASKVGSLPYKKVAYARLWGELGSFLPPLSPVIKITIKLKKNNPGKEGPPHYGWR